MSTEEIGPLAMANPHTSVKARKHGVPNKMSSARLLGLTSPQAA